jgi:hypothetical protein
MSIIKMSVSFVAGKCHSYWHRRDTLTRCCLVYVKKGNFAHNAVLHAFQMQN